jgi:hypothetical protein
MGGIVLVKKKNNWYLSHIFHLNLPPLISDPNKLYLLSSTYNTLTTKNTKIVEKIEKELLPNYELVSKKHLTDNEIIKIIKKYTISNLYLSNGRISKLLKIKNINYNRFIKELSKIKHVVYGNDLINYSNEYKLFKKIIKTIFNDELCLARTVTKPKEFIKLTNIIFSESLLIVKGLEDIKALQSHGLFLNVKVNANFEYFDIAKYNETLFKKCNSAELEKTYLCLEKLNYTQVFNKYLFKIKQIMDLKAHNPLTDAYYTWIIYNVFKE